MKRTIELYIGYNRADIDTDGLILMNYALTDLEKPTAVKNSFSKQITLPGSPANNAIFNHYYRLDRLTGTGFNASKKTPFAIYDNAGAVLQSGYLRLDSVTRKGMVVTGYKVTLFGGLGSFFYSLSYDGDGNKRTLADLDYMGTADPATEFDFTINADAVAAAWSRVRNFPVALADMWDYINFAPCYNGIPEGEFSADKGVVSVASTGLEDNIADGDKVYSSNNGYALVNLPAGVDEWAAKDLRSYLQRPVISMKAMLAAMANPANNGGYTLDYSAIPTIYKRIWKTLPMLTSLSSGKQITGDATLYNPGYEYNTGDVVGRLNVQGTIPQGMDTAATISINPLFRSTSAGLNSNYGLEYQWHDAITGKRGSRLCIYFAQVVARNGNTTIGASPVKVISTRQNWDWSSIVSNLGYTPPVAGTGYERAENIPLEVYSENNHQFCFTEWLNFQVKTSFPPTHYLVRIRQFIIQTEYNNGVSPAGGETISRISYDSANDYFRIHEAVSGNMWAPAVSVTTMRQFNSRITYSSPSGMRSGSQVTKAALLASKHTPAEYLISFCKQFGLLFLCDETEKKVTILPRDTFYDTEQENIDLSTRIDRSREIIVTPLAMTSKWYEMRNDMAEGAFAKEYAALYGMQYGIQRINTGYDFNADAVNLMDNSAFRQAATKLQHNKYWCRIVDDGHYKPSPFLDSGVTYTLWEGTTGEGKSFPVPGIPTSATFYQYNANHDFYDIDGAVVRCDLADADGKPVDGEDILLFQNSGTYYSRFKITDDTAVMVSLNDGTPCWDLSLPSGSIAVPTFSRYFIGDGDPEAEISFVRSLDFGTPRELDIPGAHMAPDASLYARYWRSYLADLLDKDTKVMKCRVDFSGLQVGPELLRRFFYYEGSYWVLNKITNYSLTTWDPVECEFIQVRDKANYYNGQTM